VLLLTQQCTLQDPTNRQQNRTRRCEWQIHSLATREPGASTHAHTQCTAVHHAQAAPKTAKTSRWVNWLGQVWPGWDGMGCDGIRCNGSDDEAACHRCSETFLTLSLCWSSQSERDSWMVTKQRSCEALASVSLALPSLGNWGSRRLRIRRCRRSLLNEDHGQVYSWSKSVESSVQDLSSSLTFSSTTIS
jgi:hypothetical protein